MPKYISCKHLINNLIIETSLKLLILQVSEFILTNVTYMYVCVYLSECVRERGAHTFLRYL